MGEVARLDQRAFPFTVGQYTVYEPFASGGMATVHPGLFSGAAGFSRQVAVKRLRPQFAADPQFVSMFLDEARLAAHIHHPNVVSTLDVIQADDELLLVMELVEGVPLSRLLAQTSSDARSIDVICSIVVGVLHGLHAAHEAKNEAGQTLDIVHRDVSPQNILVGADGVPRILDFGIAKAIGRLQGPTRLGEVKGKVHYLAPEQLSGRATRQSDVYAATVVLWEGLTGSRLFDGEHEAAILHQVLRGDVPRPSERAAAIPPALDELVMKGLDRNPRKRFPTAHDMALALTGVITPASAPEIAAWVAERCGAEISALRSKLERDAAAPPRESTAHTRKLPRLAKTGAVLIAALGLCLGLLVWAFGTAPAAPAPPVAPTLAGDPPSPSLDTAGASVLQVPAPTMTVMPPPPTAVSEPPGPAAPASPGKNDVHTRARPAREKKPCASPYSIDPDGVRRIRRECL